MKKLNKKLYSIVFHCIMILVLIKTFYDYKNAEWGEEINVSIRIALNMFLQVFLYIVKEKHKTYYILISLISMITLAIINW